MRRIAAFLLATTLAAPAGLLPAASRAQGAPGAPPHAFLFGAWTGGIFPPPSSVTAQQCLAQPTVIFTRELVLRATLTDTTYAQRSVETVRATPSGIEFRFLGSAAPGAAASLMGMAAPPLVGFGCDTPDDLRVQRISENEISFPDCREFPYPLIRCPGR